jgi:hypothetical protein
VEALSGQKRTAGTRTGAEATPQTARQRPSLPRKSGATAQTWTSRLRTVCFPPHMLLSGTFPLPEYCSDCWLRCFDGILSPFFTMQGCKGFGAVLCAGTPVEGGPCEQFEDLGNGECVAPGPGADVDAGVVNGSVCACNEPSPVWHCVEVGELR